MGIPKRIIKFLDKHKIDYERVCHPETYSSSVTAQIGHIPGKALAKVVMVKADDQDVMAVIPSNCSVDLLKLSATLRSKNVRIEEEREFEDLFPECEPGAMPPFGQIYHIPYVIDERLMEGDQIVFNAGTHRECIKLYTEDFQRILKGALADIAVTGKKIRSTV